MQRTLLDGDTGQKFDSSEIVDPALSVPAGVDDVLEPEGLTLGTNGTTVSEAEFRGSFYRVQREMSFNRLCLRMPSVAVPGQTLIAALYQAPNGTGAGTVSLVRGYAAVIAAAGTVELVGDATLAPGVCAVLWGELGAAGGFGASVYLIASVNLLTLNVTAGTRPTSFLTVIPTANPPPSTLDLTAGADAIPANAADWGLVLRTRRV